MLSREDRILAELLLSKGLVSQADLEKRPSGGHGLEQWLEEVMSEGGLDREARRKTLHESKEIDALLSPEPLPGRRLGEFQLEREIGRGGMGIVYAAVQESLGRRVALKILPAGAALDERLRIRFLKESRAVARLQHPGIIPVFASGHEEGVLFFAMELVAGGSLADRIRDAPLPPREAVQVAAQAARALHHAHREGLVHRDVKPENILMGPGLRARIGDFGLVHETRAGSETLSCYVLGTPAYAAPEQVRGEPVEARCDIYALGAVLYAMLAGRPPYRGEIPAVVVSRLLEGPPPALGSLRPGLPEGLTAICEKAMSRRREDRHPTAAALAEDLERWAEGRAGKMRPPALRKRRRQPLRRAAPVCSALVVLAALLAPQPLDRIAPEPMTGLLSGTIEPVPVAPGRKRFVSFSPDGRTLAYASDVDGDWDIYFQDVSGGEPRNLTAASPGSDLNPSFSPDGKRLSFCSPGLAVLDLGTGEVSPLMERCAHTAWSPDGGRIAYSSIAMPTGRNVFGRLWVRDLETGDVRLLTSMEAAHPAWSPDGRQMAYVSLRGGRQDIWILPVSGGEPTRLTDDQAREWSPVWSRNGFHLYFGSDRDGHPDLWRVDLDPESGRPVGEARPVTRGFMAAPFFLAAARNRDALAFAYRTGAESPYLLRIDPSSGRAMGPPRRLTPELPFKARFPRLSPSRRTWVISAATEETENLRLLVDGESNFRSVTTGPYLDRAPRWSPDGRRIAFHSNRSGRMQIWMVRPDGRGLTRITGLGRGGAICPVWSPDGRRLAFTAPGEGAYLLDLDEEGGALGREPRPLPEFGEGVFEPWSWSPDGRFLAGTAGGIVIYSVEDGRYRRLTRAGRKPVWFTGRRRLLFVQEGRIYLLNQDTGARRIVYSAWPNRVAPFLCLSADGDEIGFSLLASDEGIWILDLDRTEGLFQDPYGLRK
ncbi:MAG: protein kinase, partial [Acidobacteriota bacterium]